MPQEKTWKVIDLLKTTADFFKQKNIENPRLNAEIILADTLNCDRVNLYINFERPLSEKELSNYRVQVARRSKYEPLQYIIGKTEFMGLPFLVNPSVLIPRPETEILIDEILKLKTDSSQKESVLDIGTGSGCIAVSLAYYWKELAVTAIDISKKAVETARENATLNNISTINFFEMDIFSLTESSIINRNYDIIISNPPYISQSEFNSLQPEVKNYEPEIALTDFNDGLKFYIYILDSLQRGLINAKFLMFEMSGSQPEKIVAEAKMRNFKDITIIKDYNNIDRVLKIKL